MMLNTFGFHTVKLQRPQAYHRRFITVLSLVLLVLLSGCSAENRELIVGRWEGVQATVIEGTEDELLQHNYMEISATEIVFKSFNYVSQGDTLTKKFGDTEKVAHYELVDQDRIMIDNQLYEIKLTKDDMILMDENMEISFKKER